MAFTCAIVKLGSQRAKKDSENGLPRRGIFAQEPHGRKDNGHLMRSDDHPTAGNDISAMGHGWQWSNGQNPIVYISTSTL